MASWAGGGGKGEEEGREGKRPPRAGQGQGPRKEEAEKGEVSKGKRKGKSGA